MSRRASRNTYSESNGTNTYNINAMNVTTTNDTSSNNNNYENESYENNILSYESIMKQSIPNNDTKNSTTTPDYMIWSSLSNRLTNFRNWLEDVGCTLHPSVCIVNGEATDGTKNAPVILYGPPPPPSLIDSSNVVVNKQMSNNDTTTTSAAASAGEGRCGIIDSEVDRYLWEKTLGCQVRAARELKLNDTLCTIPRHAMITADVVACSDAGRAIYECMDHYNKTNINKQYWDDFVHASHALKKQLEKVNASNGTQLLVTILRERKRAESVGANKKYKSLDNVKQIRTGVLSSRAPLLAFLIHQRFSNHRCPPVVSNSDKNSFLLESGMRYPSNGPKTFAPYIRTFPSSLSLPIGWKRNELALLAGCITGMTVLQETAAHTLLLANDYIALIESGILLRYPHIFRPDMFTWDRWIWAASCVMSRNYPFSCYLFSNDDEDDDMNPGEKHFVLPCLNAQIHEILKLQSPMEVLEDLGLLIPFMDMLNHERENKCVLWKNPMYKNTSEEKNNSEQITLHPKAICTKRIKKGNQVYSDYGAKCNQNLILQYGFAQIHNTYDDVGIGWGLMDSIGVLMSEIDEKQKEIKESIQQLVSPNDEIFKKSQKWFIVESLDSKSKNIPFWWNEDRFYVLDKEASVRKKELVSSLKKGSKITATAYSSIEVEVKEEKKRKEKRYNYCPIFLSIALIATASPKQITDYKENESLKVNNGHQRRLRQFLISYFSSKLEKLLTNLDIGLCKAHYNNVLLWLKAKHNGIYYTPDKKEDVSENHMGWSTFFDSNVYSTSIEIEKKSGYYAISPDSCVLALYDGHLSALQCSLDGLLEKEVFDKNVLRQLKELQFDVVDEEEEEDKDVDGKEEDILPIGLQTEDKPKDGDSQNDKPKTNQSSTSSTNKTNTTSSSSRSSRKSRKSETSSKLTTQSSQGRTTTITNKASVAMNNSNSSSNPDRPPAIKLHIGNLSYSTTPSELYDYFSRMYGEDNVLECHIPIERDSGKSRGFGFVTMPFLVARKALSMPSKHHEIDKRIVKIAESNTVAGSGSGSKKRRGGGGERSREGPPLDGPSSSNHSLGGSSGGGGFVPPDRCLKCGYRPRYCFCPSPKLPPHQQPYNGNSGNGPIPPPMRGHPQSMRHPMPPMPPHHMQHPVPQHHHHHPNDIGMMGGPHHHPNDPHYHRSNRPYDPQAPPLPWRGNGSSDPRHHRSRSPLRHPSRQSPPPSRMLPPHHPGDHPPPHHRYHDDYHPYHDDYPSNYHDDYPSSRDRHRSRDRDRDRERSRDRHRSSRSYSSASSSTTSSTSSSSSSSSDTSSTTSDNSSNNHRHNRKRRRRRGGSSRRRDQYRPSSSRRASSNRKESSRRRKGSSHPQSSANAAGGTNANASSKRNDPLSDASSSSTSSSSRSNYKRHTKKKTRSSSRSNRSSNNNASSGGSGLNDRKLDDGKSKHSSSYNGGP